MSTETTDLAALYRDALVAVLEALDVPEAAIEGDHYRQRQRLLDRRADSIVEGIRSVLAFDGHPDLIRMRIDDLRVRIGRLPVLYRQYVPEAPDHPADCTICGPGCCSLVLGVHDSCPGPLVGRTAAGVR